MFLLFCLSFPDARDCCPLGLVLEYVKKSKTDFDFFPNYNQLLFYRFYNYYSTESFFRPSVCRSKNQSDLATLKLESLKTRFKIPWCVEMMVMLELNTQTQGAWPPLWYILERRRIQHDCISILVLIQILWPHHLEGCQMVTSRW